MMRLAFVLALIGSMLPCPLVAGSMDRVIHAPVIQVPDGDSLTIVLKGEMVRARLAEIDAPEGQQPFSDRS